MSASNTQQQNISGLPIPHVKLYGGDATYPQTVTLKSYVHAGNASGPDFKLRRYPLVVAMDLTTEQIEKGVYVEMSYYRGGKSQSSAGYGNESGSGYVNPAPIIGGVNPLGNKWTRGGLQQFTGGVVLAVDRPNHYQVTSQNQVINVYEYLNNRMSFMNVVYTDTAGVQQLLNVLVPSHRIKRFVKVPGRHFGYSAMLAPYYFMFRYVMWDDESNQFVSGPWSRVVKMMPDQFPFDYDEIATNTLGITAVTISPFFDPNLELCQFETHTP
jgi:hypothetical protein